MRRLRPARGDVGEYLGPIQAMLFVVPSTSSQKAISAEMARAVFGRGGAQGLTQPWVTPTLYFVRNASTGTQQMISSAIGVPADQFWGVDRGSARNVAALLTVLSSGADRVSAEQAIGILSNDYYDADRGNLTALAFQAVNQSCGYLPDSTAFKTDKRNVRDGHYPIWGPLHFFANTAQGIPTSPAAQAFVSVVAEPEPGPDLLDAYIDSGLVPSCAMSVKRATDLGPLSAYVPPVMCGCHFEARLAGPDAAAAGRLRAVHDRGRVHGSGAPGVPAGILRGALRRRSAEALGRHSRPTSCSRTQPSRPFGRRMRSQS